MPESGRNNPVTSAATPEHGHHRDARSCIGEATLAAFAEGQLDRGARTLVERHLADCGDCRAVVAATAGAIHSEVAGASVPSTEAGRHVSGSAGGSSEQTGSTLAAGAWSEHGGGELTAGSRVGRYVIEGLVGSGSMGAVYAASDPDLARTVAVKLLRSEELSDSARQQVRARLLREAQAMARLSHPEVITVYDVGAFGDQLFVAMEYVEGTTLRRWRVERHRSCAEILEVYERAGSGLAAAHEAGLVHRDFKPDNVLVGRDGRVRVTDFGLARSARAAPAPAPTSSDAGDSAVLTLTRTGTLLGTPAYMAPEQLRGGTADARSDVFAFCVALYEALYGERPFPGSTVDSLRASIEAGHVRAAPIVNRVPGWTRSVLLRGLRAAPELRFESMRALLDGLRASRMASRRRVGRGLAISALGVFAAFAAFAAWTGRMHATTRQHVAVASSAVLGNANAGPVGLPRDMESHPTRGRGDDVPAPAPDQVTPAAEPLAASSANRPFGAGSGSASTSARRARGAPPAASNAGPAVGNNGAFILE